MSTHTPPVNKRTVLGSQYWAVGIAVGLAPGSLPLTVALIVPLVVIGAYLLLAPRVQSAR